MSAIARQAKNKSVAVTVVAALLLTHSAPVMAQVAVIKNQTLRYSLHYGAYAGGELEVVIERDGAQIKTVVISHFNLAARWFISDATAENWFDIERGKVYLARGHTLSHGDKAGNKAGARSFVIDREQGRVTLQPGGRVVAVGATDVFASDTFPIGLMTSDIASIAGQTVREVSPRRVREYVYLAPEQQTLEVGGKRFETWKVTRQKLGETRRTVTLWLDKNNQQIPVKIIITKKNRDTVMTLLPEA